MRELFESSYLSVMSEENDKLRKEIERLRLELSGYRQAILQDKEMLGLKQENELLHSIIKEVREKINNFDVFKEFTFPLMKRDEENQVKSSIDYEWRKSIKEPLLKILDKENKNE